MQCAHQTRTAAWHFSSQSRCVFCVLNTSRGRVYALNIPGYIHFIPVTDIAVVIRHCCIRTFRMLLPFDAITVAMDLRRALSGHWKLTLSAKELSTMIFHLLSVL